MLAFISSPQDWMVIFLIVFLLFGAKKLPELARGFGKAMGEFKKARDEFEREITHAVKQAESEAVVTKEPVSTDISHEHLSPTPDLAREHPSPAPDLAHEHPSPAPDTAHEHPSPAPDTAKEHVSATPDVATDHGIKEPAGKEPYAS